MAETYEVFEDADGEYRWRLVAGNGEVMANSGEGYATREGAESAIERVRGYADSANTLEVGRAAFEIYEDARSRYRWRLRHRNGNIIAASTGGYSSRSNARDAIDRLQEDIEHAPLERR